MPAEALRIGLVHRVAAADAIEVGECGAPARPWLHAGYVGPKPVASQVKKDCLPSSICASLRSKEFAIHPGGCCRL